ncbi:MAG: demethoxyubiquinone hydroxylase family protein [Candidatus Nanoarchaeia archaeon]
MMSEIPKDLNKLNSIEKTKEALRVGMIAELDAINLYEQLAAIVADKKIKAVFEDIIKEEKTHVGEFQTLLLKLDEEQKKELEEGKKEVENITNE